MLAQNVKLSGQIILVTGAAGFVGSNLVMELLRTVDNVTIVGLDNMNDYYDVSIKEYRLKEIEKLADQGAEGVILGCTEIGLLIKQEDVNIPVFDTTMIHATKAAEMALEG